MEHTAVRKNNYESWREGQFFREQGAKTPIPHHGRALIASTRCTPNTDFCLRVYMYVTNTKKIHQRYSLPTNYRHLHRHHIVGGWGTAHLHLSAHSWGRSAHVWGRSARTLVPGHHHTALFHTRYQ